MNPAGSRAGARRLYALLLLAAFLLSYTPLPYTWQHGSMEGSGVIVAQGQERVLPIKTITIPAPTPEEADRIVRENWRRIFEFTDESDNYTSILGRSPESLECWDTVIPYPDGMYVILKFRRLNDSCLGYYILYNSTSDTVARVRVYNLSLLACPQVEEYARMDSPPLMHGTAVYPLSDYQVLLVSWKRRAYGQEILYVNESELDLSRTESLALEYNYHRGFLVVARLGDAPHVRLYYAGDLFYKQHDDLLGFSLSPLASTITMGSAQPSDAPEIHFEARPIFRVSNDWRRDFWRYFLLHKLESIQVYEDEWNNLTNQGIVLASIDPQTLDVHAVFFQSQWGPIMGAAATLSTGGYAVAFTPDWSRRGEYPLNATQIAVAVYNETSAAAPAWVRVVNVNMEALGEYLSYYDYTNRTEEFTVTKVLQLFEAETRGGDDVLVLTAQTSPSHDEFCDWLTGCMGALVIIALDVDNGSVRWARAFPMAPGYGHVTLLDRGRLLVTADIPNLRFTGPNSLLRNDFVDSFHWIIDLDMGDVYTASQTLTRSFFAVELAETPQAPEALSYTAFHGVVLNGDLFVAGEDGVYYTARIWPWAPAPGAAGLASWNIVNDTLKYKMMKYNGAPFASAEDPGPDVTLVHKHSYTFIVVGRQSLDPDPVAETFNLTRTVTRLSNNATLKVNMTNRQIALQPRIIHPIAVPPGAPSYWYSPLDGATIRFEEPIIGGEFTLSLDAVQLIYGGYRIKITLPLVKDTLVSMEKNGNTPKACTDSARIIGAWSRVYRLIPESTRLTQNPDGQWIAECTLILRTTNPSLAHRIDYYIGDKFIVVPVFALGEAMLHRIHYGLVIKVEVATLEGVISYYPPSLDGAEEIAEYPLTAARVDLYEIVVSREWYFLVGITNVGFSEGVFVHAILLPFFIKVEGVSFSGDGLLLWRAQLSEIHDVEDADLVYLVVSRLEPGEYIRLRVRFTARPEYIQELFPVSVEDPNDTWHGFKVAGLVGGGVGPRRQISQYSPLVVQMANLPVDWWESNVTVDWGRPLDTIEAAVNASLDFNEYFFDKLKDMGANASIAIARLMNATTPDGLPFIPARMLGNYLNEALWTWEARNRVVSDLVGDGLGEVHATPVDVVAFEARGELERLYDEERMEYYLKHYNGTHPFAVELISLAQDYNLVHILSKLADPLAGYQLINVTINGSSQPPGFLVAGCLLPTTLLQSGSAERRLVWSVLAAPLSTMDNCLRHFPSTRASAMPPEIWEDAFARGLFATGNPWLGAVSSLAELLAKADSASGRIAALREAMLERYGTADPRELLRVTGGSDPEAVEYAMLMLKRYNSVRVLNGIAGTIASLDPMVLLSLLNGGEASDPALLSPFYAYIIGRLDQAGLTAELANYGYYFYGSTIADPTGAAEEAFIAGYLAGTVAFISFDALPLIAMGVDQARYAMAMARARGIAVDLAEVSKANLVNMKDPRLVQVTATMLDHYLTPAAYRIALGDTREGARLMGEALEYMRSQGLLAPVEQSTEILAYDHFSVMFASKPLGPYPKPFIVEVRYSDNALGAIATISREPGTGYNYLSFGHVRGKKYTINAGGTVKTIHPADLHIFTMGEVPYIYSMESGSIIVSRELVEAYSGSPVQLAELFDSSGFRAVASYILREDAGVEDAYRLLGLYRELKFKIKRSVANPEVAKEIINLLDSYMARGDYQGILALGRDYGLVDASGAITGVKVTVMKAEEVFRHAKQLGEVSLFRRAKLTIDEALRRAAEEAALDEALIDAAKAYQAYHMDMLDWLEAPAYVNVLRGETAASLPALLDMIDDESMGMSNALRALAAGTRPPFVDDCRGGPLPLQDDFAPFAWDPYARILTSARLLFSLDPNDIEALNGPYITSRAEPARFTVHFENSANATLEAENVTIRLHLEGPLDVAGLMVEEVHPRPEYMEVANETTARGALVTIRLVGVDLPPNRNPPEGEGHVKVSIPLAPGAGDGDRVRAWASIVFDNNPPVDTRTVTLVLDFSPPRLAVAEASREAGAVRVVYTCTDAASGCGAVYFKVYSGELEELALASTNESAGTEVIPVDGTPAYLSIVAIDRAGWYSEAATLKLSEPQQPHQPPETTTPPTQTPTTTPPPTTTTQTTTTPAPAETTPPPPPAGTTEGRSGPALALAVAAVAALAVAAYLYTRRRRS